MKKPILSALALGTLTLAAQDHLRSDASPARVVVKHREHNGIGYDTGYTTAQIFAAPAWKNGMLPFLDLRGHAFNDGRFAANAGVGMRFNWSNYTVGGTVYYDYREAKNIHPHQLAGGLEFLHKWFDVRLNGYGPIADVKHARPDQFVRFSGNGVVYKHRVRSALPVIEGEIGAPLGRRCGAWDWYAALGSYYLFERTVNNVRTGDAVGGRGRIVLDIINRFNFRADVAYDKINKWTIQGTGAVSLPIGKGLRGHKVHVCQARNQLPERFEIIPVERKSKEFIPINPATGLPFFFIFVDNTSSSSGTFGSPFNNWDDAETASKAGDIIYIFPGDGTATGLTTLFTMKRDQQLIGSGIDSNLNGLILPALTPGINPNVAPAASSAIVMNANTTVAGLTISGDGTNIAITSTANGMATLYKNNINFLGANAGGADFAPTAGATVIAQDNIFRRTVAGTSQNGLTVTGAAGTVRVAAVGNELVRVGENGVELLATTTCTMEGFVTNNISRGSDRSVRLATEDSSRGMFSVLRNRSGPNNPGQNQGRTTASIAMDSSRMITLFESNTSQQVDNDDYEITAEDASRQIVVWRNNTGVAGNNQMVLINPESTGRCEYTLIVNECISYSSSGIDIDSTGAAGSVNVVSLIENNYFNGFNANGGGIFVELNSTGSFDTTIRNNISENLSSSTNAVQARSNMSGGTHRVHIMGNTFNDNNILLRTVGGGTSTVCAGLAGNSSSGTVSIERSSGILQVESTDGT